jgi:hypothetical protein
MVIKGKRNKARVKQRQKEAIERQVVRDERIHEEQLKVIKLRRGESKKEKHKLIKLIEKAYKKSKKKNAKK